MNKKFFSLLTRKKREPLEATGGSITTFNLSKNNGIQEIIIYGASVKEGDSYHFVGNEVYADEYSEAEYEIPLRVHGVNGYNASDLALAFKNNNPSVSVAVFANARLGFYCNDESGAKLLGKKDIRFKPQTYYTFSLPMTIPQDSFQSPYARTQLGVLYTDGTVDEIKVISDSTANDIDFITNPQKTVEGLVHIFVNAEPHYIKFKGMGIYEENMGSVSNYTAYSGTSATVSVPAPLRAAVDGEKILRDELRCLSGTLTRRVGYLDFGTLSSSSVFSVKLPGLTIFTIKLSSPCDTVSPYLTSEVFKKSHSDAIGTEIYSMAVSADGSEIYLTLDHATSEVSDAVAQLRSLGAGILYALATPEESSVTPVAAIRPRGYNCVEVLTETDPSALTVLYK